MLFLLFSHDDAAPLPKALPKNERSAQFHSPPSAWGFLPGTLLYTCCILVRTGSLSAYLLHKAAHLEAAESHSEEALSTKLLYRGDEAFLLKQNQIQALLPLLFPHKTRQSCLPPKVPVQYRG